MQKAKKMEVQDRLFQMTIGNHSTTAQTLLLERVGLTFHLDWKTLIGMATCPLGVVL